MRRLLLLAVVLLTVIGFIVPTTVSAQSCPAGYVTTSLGTEGVPNLFRLGLKYGVSWTRIILPTGAAPVPEHIFPNTIVCVPTGGTTIIVIINPNPGVPTPQPAAVPPPAPPVPFDPIADYCKNVPVHGTPDRGSCLLEARSIAFGKQRIIQSGIVCTPQELSRQSNGTFRQCSIFGDKWLTADKPTDTGVDRLLKEVPYNGSSTIIWGNGWGFVTFTCINSGLNGFATRLDQFDPTGVFLPNVTFGVAVSAVPNWDEVMARVEAQRRGLTEFNPATCP